MLVNVNHYPRTLDRKRSLRFMEIISPTTAQDVEGVAASFIMPAMLRKKLEKAADVKKDKFGPLMHNVKQKETSLSKIKTFKDLPTFEPSHIIPTIYYLNVFWYSSHFIQRNNCANWSGLSKNECWMNILIKQLYPNFLYWI